jgi:PAS domain S-box-containing protein
MPNLYQAIKKTKEFKHLLTGFLSGLLLFITLIYGVSYNLHRENELSRWTFHSQEEIYQIEKTISLAKDYETSARGFILTNQDKFEKPLTAAALTLDQEIIHLEELIANDAAQKQPLDSLAYYLHKKVAFSKLAIRVRREQGLSQAMQLIATAEGLGYMDKIRQIAHGMEQHEKQVLAQRQKASKQARQVTNLILLASLVFFVLLLLYVLWKSWRQEENKKRTEEKLNQKDERYRALIEHNSEAIVLRDENFAIIYWSPAAEKMLGWTPEEVAMPGFEVPVHPEHQEQRQQLKQALIRQPGLPVKQLRQMRHKNGHYIWLEGESMNLLHQPSVQAIVTNFRDVSGRVQADLEVQKAHALLEKAVNNLSRIMDSSLDVICTMDAESRFLQVSAAAAAIWGYGPEELVGRSAMDLVAEQDQERTARIAASIMSGTPVTTFENHFVRPDGSLVPVLWSAQWHEADQLFYCIAKDATEKEQLEKAFRNEQKRFNDLFMQAPSSICIFKGADHRYISTNTIYDFQVGGRPLIGRTFQEAFPELIQQGFLEILDKVYQTGEPFFGIETPLWLDLEGDGQLTDLYLDILYQPYSNSAGEVEGVFFFGVDVTEQVQTRKKIEESERNFRQLIQDLPAAVYTCDAAGSIQLFNKAAVELWGREPQVGQDLWCGSWQIYDAAGQPVAPEEGPMARTLRNGMPVQGQEIIIARPNGERRYAMPHPVLRYNAAGQLTGGINILIDTTESKSASDQIRRSETALAEAQHIAKIGSWNLDVYSQRLTCSEELYQIFETDKESFVETYDGFLGFVDEADRELAQQVTMKAYTDGDPFDVEYHITTGQGKSRMVNVLGKCQQDATGQIIRLFGTTQDITERKQVESALQTSEEKYKLLFYQAPLPKWIYDLETLQILDVNESAIEQYGYSREEFLGLTATDLRPAADVAPMINIIQEKKAGKGILRFGLWNHITKLGTLIKVEITGHTIQYDNRDCIIVEANDVTEKARAENALKISNARWETISKVTFDAIWDWDLKNEHLFWGNNFEALFGYPIEENKDSYQAWVDYMHPEDRQRVQESVESFLLSPGTIWQEEYRLLKACGAYATCTDRALVIRDEAGVPSRMIGAIRDVTESRIAEENLRSEKIFSEALLEATPDGMVGFNDEGKIILFNKKAESLFGYSQEEILGASVTTLLPENAHAAHHERRQDFFANPTQQKLVANSQEMLGTRQNGEEFPADVRLNFLNSSKGKIVITSIRDITLRKRGERQLKESEKNLKAILSSSQEAIYLLDVNLRMVLQNELCADLLQRGYGAVCTPGDDFLAKFEPDFRSRLMAIFQQVLAGEKWESDRTIPLPEGEAYYHSNYFPVRDHEGNIIGICCSSKDINERKKIEAAMAIANAEKEDYQYRFQAILDYSPQAVLIKDMEGKYIFSNKAFLNLFNLDRNNEVSHQLIAVFDDQIARAEFRAIVEKTDPGEIKTREWTQQVRLPDGQTLEMEILKFPLYDRQKRLSGICTICKDITEQVHHQQQLIQARENAEHAERLQEQFLANMSHELRTPMNGIIGMVNLLMTSSTLQPDQKGRLQIIKRSSDTLLNLINDILDLSKIKAGMLTIEKINFDFNESISGTALLFKQRAKEKGIKLTVSADPFIPRLLVGDPHRLNQILNNLLSNSIKFTEKGFVRLEASLQSETEDEVVVTFVVTDSGIGIETANLHYIFDNFAQASTEISSKYGGTGLGLAITKRLIEMQGGDITVESTKGQGTTFTFQLLYAITKDTGAVVNPYHQNMPVPVKKSYEGKRALIVEDNDINQLVLASSLKQHQLDIFLANHGQEAIDLLESGEQFDIIFMDLRMPVMNGFLATAYIRQTLHLTVPIVILTASVLRNERDRSLEVGASDYMAKPLAMAELARALEQFLTPPKHWSDTTREPAAQTAPPSVPRADFDISRLMELEDPDYIRHIFKLFTEKIPPYLLELKSFLSTGGQEEFLEKTHKIKGSFSSIEIREIYQLVLTMENKVQAQQHLDQVELLVDKCLALYNELIPAIKQEVEKQLAILDAHL